MALSPALRFWLILFFGAVASRGATVEIPITGRVLDSDRTGVAGIEVRLEPIQSTYERSRLRSAAEAGVGPLRRTETDSAGFFELIAPKAGLWTVVAAAPDRLPVEYRLEPLVAARNLPTLTLTPAAELAIRLSDARGMPLSGTVGIHSRDRRPGDWRLRPRLARTREDGTARLPRGRDERGWVEAMVPGFAPVVLGVDLPSSIRLTMDAGKRVRAQVIGIGERPVSEALAFRANGLLPLGLSDKAGHLDLRIASKAPASILVLTRDGRSAVLTIPNDHDDELLNLRLEPPTLLHGRVVDQVSRDPISDAVVWSAYGELARSDARGSYALEVPGLDRQLLRSAAVGYRPAAEDREAEDGVGPTFALSPTAAVSGRVTDIGGRPVLGVDVRVLPRSPYDTAQFWELRRFPERRFDTSREGRFQLSGLPAGISYELRFVKSTFAPVRLVLGALEPFESHSRLEVTLEPGRLAVGRVADPEGGAVAGALVRLELPQNNSAFGGNAHRRKKTALEPTSLTDASGRFEISDLAPGRYDLRVEAAGFAPARVPGRHVDSDAEETDLGTVVLGAGAVLEGRVRDPQDRPVVASEVRVIPVGHAVNFDSVSDPPDSTSGADGFFAVADLFPGRLVTLLITKPGYGSAFVRSIRVPTEVPLEVKLAPTARVSGRVIDQAGRPLGGAWVWVWTEREDRWQEDDLRTRTAADGEFILEEVELGSITVTAQASGYRKNQVSGLLVPAGGVRDDLEIVLEPGTTIEGTVSDGAGRPVPRALVHITPHDEGSHPRGEVGTAARTDAAGRFRLRGVPPGPATVQARQGARRKAAEMLVIEAGRQRVDLRLESGFDVSGRVVGPYGDPVGGAAVSLRAEAGVDGNPSPSPLRSSTTAEGSFTFLDVPAGRYTLFASREGFAETVSEPFLAEGDVRGIELRLERGAVLRGRIVGLDLEELASLVLTARSDSGTVRQGRVDHLAEYSVANLAAGRWTLRAEVGASGRTALEEVVVEASTSEIQVDLELGTGFTLSGFVFDRGVPLAGIDVTVLGSERGFGRAETDSSGRFVIENLETDSYRVTLMAGSLAEHVVEAELFSDHELTIELATARISGMLRDALDAEAIAGADVRLERLATGSRRPSMLRFTSGSFVRSDSLGRFAFRKVGEGSWRLSASKPGYLTAERRIEVRPGAEGDSFELRLKPVESPMKAR